MNMIGVIEGFFGPQWPMEARMSYAEFLFEFGGDFFIYAPKQDPYLRKKWRENWTPVYLEHLRSMAENFQDYGVKFGVGFSPFGLGTSLTEEDKIHLKDKIELLESIGVDMLGLFFDDMPVTDNLAGTQIEALAIFKKHFKGKIIFCPSFYTPDPILDKVFGQRPEQYLAQIANGVSQDVSVAWTGPKVISLEIPVEHLQETTNLLKRKPFIWENLFANDGPRNCKFLKLKPFSGRSKESFNHTEAFGFNMMNQPELSKIMYLSSLLVLKKGLLPLHAFDAAFSELCSPEFAEFMRKNNDLFLVKGLDVIPQEEKDQLIVHLKSFSDKAAIEVIDWLMGKYNVGSECLTD
jgi:hyaluronoglucosaminidase